MVTANINKAPDILIIGSGNLAHSVVNALCHLQGKAKVTIAGRDKEVVSSLVLTANVRAFFNSSDISFDYAVLESGYENLEELVLTINPWVLLNCASLHSNWTQAANHPWERLIAKHGFGSTTLLQLPIAIRIATVIKRKNLSCFYINACYPDVVNPILHALKLPVSCGVGNVAIIEYLTRFILKIQVEKRIKIIAHHFHVAQLIGPAEKRFSFPKIWVEDEELTAVEELFKSIQLPSNSSINYITGFSIARMLLDIVQGKTIQANLPGVKGLPGGLPVEISQHQCEVMLPAGIEWNEIDQMYKALELKEGISYRNGSLTFHEEVHSYLRMILPEFSQSISIQELPTIFSNQYVMNTLANHKTYANASF